MKDATRQGSAASSARGPWRWLLLGVGLAFTLLGTLGAFLPVLPTTPFPLVAAACFARSSPSFHRPYPAQWQRGRTVPRSARRKAYGAVVVTFALLLSLVDSLGLRWGLAALGLALLASLRALPVTPRAPAPPAAGRREDPEASGDRLAGRGQR